MKFDVIFGNPPFQDNKNKKKTQHKLWIEFTTKSINEWLRIDGYLCWITPQSWGSPSNSILQIFKDNDLKDMHLDTKKHFPDIGSSFSHYLIKKGKTGVATTFHKEGDEFDFQLDDNAFYVPNDFCEHSISIHKKVMFLSELKYNVKKDYVTCHNVIRRAFINHDKKIEAQRNKLKTLICESKIEKCQTYLNKLISGRKKIDITVSEVETKQHIYPVLHTNKSIWYSSIKQDFLDKKKVMWSRSGYTKPFYDDGDLGCTDMGYYILVNDDKEGERLVSFLNCKLMQYIFKTAKWSGFGNERVFSSIPKVDLPPAIDDGSVYDLFSISEAEREYIESSFTKKGKKRTKPPSETKSSQRVKHFGEVFTPLGLVKEMLDMVTDCIWQDDTKTFIDPACGNGNFLVEIFLKRLDNGVSPEKAAETLYGIDIMEDNIREAKERILSHCRKNNLFTDKLSDTLDKNIVLSNALEQRMDQVFS
tara:strand:- start:1230 stop:2657 length:1428 start_codon:yes stop_codon:yes gene_type:complete